MNFDEGEILELKRITSGSPELLLTSTTSRNELEENKKKTLQSCGRSAFKSIFCLTQKNLLLLFLLRVGLFVGCRRYTLGKNKRKKVLFKNCYSLLAIDSNRQRRNGSRKDVFNKAIFLKSTPCWYNLR
jgi:hypothetical protein